MSHKPVCGSPTSLVHTVLLMSGRGGYCVTQACVWESDLTSSHCVVDEWAWWLMCHTSLCVGVRPH